METDPKIVEAYLEKIRVFFYRVQNLQHRRLGFDDLHSVSKQEQEFFINAGKEIFQYFQEFMERIDFRKWIAYGGECATAMAQGANTGRLYAIRIARPAFNDPDREIEEEVHVGLLRKEKRKKVIKNEFRERWLLGLKSQKEFYTRIVSQSFNLARVQKVFHVNKLPTFAILEWVEGVLFNEFCKLYSDDSKRKSFAFWRFCKLVQKMHSMGYIHRDLKPDNLIVSKHDIPVLIDFGITKDMTVDRDLTVEGTQLGNVRFSAPEQVVDGNAQLATFKSDVYSLGWLLYYVLTNQYPPTHLWQRQLKVSEQRQIPSVFRDIFMHATLDKIESRPDIDQFVDTIEEIFRQEGVYFNPDEVIEPKDGEAKIEVTDTETANRVVAIEAALYEIEKILKGMIQ